LVSFIATRDFAALSQAKISCDFLFPFTQPRAGSFIALCCSFIASQDFAAISWFNLHNQVFEALWHFAEDFPQTKTSRR
jgi:hypothetical protein